MVSAVTGLIPDAGSRTTTTNSSASSGVASTTLPTSSRPSPTPCIHLFLHFLQNSVFSPTSLAYRLIKQDADFAQMHGSHPPTSLALIRRDNHGRPSKQTDEGPSQESLVRLLPAGPICPLVWLREGRRRPDSSIPKQCNPGLSRSSACFGLMSFGTGLIRNRCVDADILDRLGGWP